MSYPPGPMRKIDIAAIEIAASILVNTRLLRQLDKQAQVAGRPRAELVAEFSYESANALGIEANDW